MEECIKKTVLHEEKRKGSYTQKNDSLQSHKFSMSERQGQGIFSTVSGQELPVMEATRYQDAKSLHVIQD